MQMTGTVTNLLSTALNDPEEPFTPELDETASSVTGCLSNVLKSASGGSQPNDTSQVTPAPLPQHMIFTGTRNSVNC